MKREVLKGSCPLIDGEQVRGRVAYDLWPSIAEAPVDGFEYRGTVHSEDPGAGAALIDLFGRDAPMSLAFQDGRRLDIVAMMHVFRGEGQGEIAAVSRGPIYRAGERPE